MNTVTDRLSSHLATVSPGLPFHIGAQHIDVPEPLPQGDLYMRILPVDAKPPKDYVLVKNPTDADRQLAIESGAGSHHRLQSLDGVTMWRPKNWGEDESDLCGPFVRFAKPNAIKHEPGHDHPHGTAHVDVPCSVEFRYQRNLDAISRAEIRARD